jgi:Ca2+:H+ antiporter
VGIDLTAEALTDSLEGIGEHSGVTKEWLGLILLAVYVLS